MTVCEETGSDRNEDVGPTDGHATMTNLTKIPCEKRTYQGNNYVENITER